jgi:GNAT superfamily N-acetyltransferase
MTGSPATDVEALRRDAFELKRPGEPFDPGYRLPFETARFGVTVVRFQEAGILVGGATLYDASTHHASRFFHLRRDLEGKRVDACIARLLGTAAAQGGGRPLLVDYEWARAPVPAATLEGFVRAGFTRADQAVLALPLGPGTRRESPEIPTGYALVDLADDLVPAAIDCMTASPEPGAFVWTPEFCRRTVYGVAEADPPYFPGGRAKALVKDGQVAAFVVGTAAGVIQLVYCAPAHRGRGLAAICLAAVLDVLEKEGLTESTVPVIAENATARRLYERMGFVERRRYPQLHRLI